MKILVILYLFVMTWVFIDLNCINFNDNNFDEDDLGTIIHVRLLAWYIKFEKRKAL